MSINELFQTNVKRCLHWHKNGIEEWSPLEWAGAMAGEAGEAANAAKKMKRMETETASINKGERHYTQKIQAAEAVGKEVADTIIYGLLLMARVGITDPEAVIRDVFNKKSEEYGFPERV